MHDTSTVRDQPIGDEGTVAVSRVALRAHDAHALVLIDERTGGGLELLGFHVVGVRLSHAPERLAFPQVLNPGLPQGSGKRITGKLRMTARSRIGAHIDERAYPGCLEDRE